METTLHQQLKRCYAQDDDSTEVVLGQYRIDAIRDDELIEVQCASLSAIRDKCRNLLKQTPASGGQAGGDAHANRQGKKTRRTSDFAKAEPQTWKPAGTL